MTEKDWVDWHESYDQPDSPLAQRLVIVQEQLGLALDRRPPGQIRTLSLCAGQGRDLIGTLSRHPRREDVIATLVELDDRNVLAAREAAALAGLKRVEVVLGDAGLTATYAESLPADVLLLCGIFGNVTREDVERTIVHLPHVCAPGGNVIWTRHRNPPDLVPTLCRWFEDRGFELMYVTDPRVKQSVGAHRFAGRYRPLAAAVRLFTFLGYDEIERREAGLPGAVRSDS